MRFMPCVIRFCEYYRVRMREQSKIRFGIVDSNLTEQEHAVLCTCI